MARLVLDGYQRRVLLEDLELEVLGAAVGGAQCADDRHQLVAGGREAWRSRRSPNASTPNA